jgi:arylsulfatase A-like enzyme
MLDGYERAIAYVDLQLRGLWEALDRRGVLDRALIIITSDHGEQFGEHGLFEHGNSLYQPLIRVPLLIVDRGGRSAGTIVSTPVSLRDVAATIMHFVDAEDDSAIPGRSLLRALDGGDDAPGPSPVVAVLAQRVGEGTAPVFRGDIRSLVSGPWHYIRSGEGEELYRYDEDPMERADVSPLEAAVLRAMRAMVDSIVPP